MCRVYPSSLLVKKLVVRSLVVQGKNFGFSSPGAVIVRGNLCAISDWVDTSIVCAVDPSMSSVGDVANLLEYVGVQTQREGLAWWDLAHAIPVIIAPEIWTPSVASVSCRPVYGQATDCFTGGGWIPIEIKVCVESLAGFDLRIGPRHPSNNIDYRGSLMTLLS